jgi:hypothetical protein
MKNEKKKKKKNKPKKTTKNTKQKAWNYNDYTLKYDPVTSSLLVCHTIDWEVYLFFYLIHK